MPKWFIQGLPHKPSWVEQMFIGGRQYGKTEIVRNRIKEAIENGEQIILTDAPSIQDKLKEWPAMQLYDRVPENITPAQRADQEFQLNRTACMMVDWFADRAFTCPDSLAGTIETYKGLIVQNAHNAA